MAEEDPIQYQKEGHVLWIWLNRPAKRNALTSPMINRLCDVVAMADADPAIRILVIRGRQGTFCAGQDMNEPPECPECPPGLKAWRRLAALLMGAATPSLAVLEGQVVGGGHSFMLAFDFVIASTQARIGDYYITRGLISGVNGAYRLSRTLGLKRAKEMVLTGRLLTGEEAAEWGLINSAFPPELLDAAVREFTDQFAKHARTPMAHGKWSIDGAHDRDFQASGLLQHLAVSVTSAASLDDKTP